MKNVSLVECNQAMHASIAVEPKKTILLVSVGAPDSGYGQVGELCFDSENKAFYGPKTEAGWGNPGFLLPADSQWGEDHHPGPLPKGGGEEKGKKGKP